MGSYDGILSFGVIIMIAIFVIIITVIAPTTSDQNTQERKQCVENFSKTPADFKVFNYLPNHSISMEVLEQKPESIQQAERDVMTGASPHMNPVLLIDKIHSMKAGGLQKHKVSKYLKEGNIVRFNIVKADGTKQHYTDYIVNTRHGERIKNLHVGMVTTRFMADSTDGLRLTTTSGNAVGGNAWLVIHNTTNVPLSLNKGEIVVAPHSTHRYLGYLNQGVTLGTYFKDDNGFYPDFQYLQPHTDLYYGIVSDLQQALYGCAQYQVFNDECNFGETFWPFQDGIY